jgi:hypothetical protein
MRLRSGQILLLIPRTIHSFRSPKQEMGSCFYLPDIAVVSGEI